MGDVINLRRARKGKAREESGEKAAANRAQHGRTKAERKQSEKETLRITRVHEAHQREKAKGETDGE